MQYLRNHEPDTCQGAEVGGGIRKENHGPYKYRPTPFGLGNSGDGYYLISLMVSS